jgi:hypothetical protein
MWKNVLGMRMRQDYVVFMLAENQDSNPLRFVWKRCFLDEAEPTIRRHHNIA